MQGIHRRLQQGNDENVQTKKINVNNNTFILNLITRSLHETR